MIRGQACGLKIDAIDELAPAIRCVRPYHRRNVIEDFQLKPHGFQSRVVPGNLTTQRVVLPDKLSFAPTLRSTGCNQCFLLC